MRAGKLWVLSVVIVLSALGGRASGDTILNPGANATALRTWAGDGGTPDTSPILVNPTALPFLGTSTATDGTASSTTSYTLTGGGFGISYVNHSRPGAFNASAISDGNIYFSVTTDTTYSAAGSYTASHAGAAGNVQQWVFLRDLTTNTDLFYSDQDSVNTANETFVLGQPGGDDFNNHFGSLTGALLAGHEYRLFYRAQVGAYQDADDGAVGSGNLTLSIGPVATPVPLPASAWLGLALLGGLGLSKLSYRRTEPLAA